MSLGYPADAEFPEAVRLRIPSSMTNGTVDLSTGVTMLQSVAEFALGRFPSGKAQPVLTVRCLPASSGESLHPFPLGARAFQLKGAVYGYEPDQLRYHVTAADHAIRGTIDLRSSSADWVMSENVLPRAAFHTTILDPLSLILPRYRMMVCHGSAITTPHGAALLLGPSGSGKSTVAALLTSYHGMCHLSDDTFVLDFRSDPVMVHSVHTGFGLSPSLADQLGIQADPDNVLQRSRGKIYLKSFPHQDDTPRAVWQVLFLSRSETSASGMSISRLGTTATLLGLLDSQTTIGNPHAEERLRMWEGLAGQVQGYRIRTGIHFEVPLIGKLLHETR